RRAAPIVARLGDIRRVTARPRSARSAPLRGSVAPVDGDARGLVRMLLEPAAGVRAPRRDGLPGAGRALDRRPHEAATDAPAPELVGDLRVHEDEPAVPGAVQQLGLDAVLDVDEPAPVAVVHDRLVGVGHRSPFSRRVDSVPGYGGWAEI